MQSFICSKVQHSWSEDLTWSSPVKPHESGPASASANDLQHCRNDDMLRRVTKGARKREDPNTRGSRIP
jgi:hypothetical protein